MATEQQIKAAAAIILPLTDATPNYARSVIRDALDAAERAAWCFDMSAAPSGTPLLVWRRNMRRICVEVFDGSRWMDGGLFWPTAPDAWAPLPASPAEEK